MDKPEITASTYRNSRRKMMLNSALTTLGVWRVPSDLWSLISGSSSSAGMELILQANARDYYLTTQ